MILKINIDNFVRLILSIIFKVSHVYGNVAIGGDTVSFNERGNVDGVRSNSMIDLKICMEDVIAMLGAVSHIVARTFFGLAQTPFAFYIGGAISSIGCITLPILKSMISKMVDSSEKGKVFAWVSVCTNSVQFMSGIIYSRIYILTIGGTGGIFWFTLFTQVVVFLLLLGYEVSQKYFKFEDVSTLSDEVTAVRNGENIEATETLKTLLNKNEQI